MAISRYRLATPLLAKFPFRRNPRTNKAVTLTFFNGLSFRNPADVDLELLQVEEISFGSADTLASLAQKFYGNASYWWIIALINNISSEHEIDQGQDLVILLPAADVIAAFGV